jgi:hypothetical protein
MAEEMNWTWWISMVRSWLLRRRDKTISSLEYSRWKKEKICFSQSYRRHRASRGRLTALWRAWCKLDTITTLNATSLKRRSRQTCSQVWKPSKVRQLDQTYLWILRVAAQNLAQACTLTKECKLPDHHWLAAYLSHSRSRNLIRRNHRLIMEQVWVLTSQLQLLSSMGQTKCLIHLRRIRFKFHNSPVTFKNLLLA